MSLTRIEKDRITDFFEPWELAEFLRVEIEDFIEAFEDNIEDALDDLNEIMGLKGANDNDETEA
jgi:hypothetical protein